jgi:FKBP-type peptidyl-prolyl cis-trans isomerase 2
MDRINPKTTADLYFQLKWTSPGVRHTDACSGYHVNFWRDLLPKSLPEELMGRWSGDLIHLQLAAKDLLNNAASHNIQHIPRHLFKGSRINEPGLIPRSGRFYPKGVLADMPGIFRANRDPFRCIEVHNGHIGMLMGHPVAGRQIEMNVTVGAIHSKLEERGGSVNDWGEIITRGVGMQARWQDRPTDFFSDNPFTRKDESPDEVFYAKPRLVHHIDASAADMLRQIHARFVSAHTRVLDLMSSWQSHLPYGLHPKQITGLGLNEAELSKNGLLSDYAA